MRALIRAGKRVVGVLRSSVLVCPRCESLLQEVEALRKENQAHKEENGGCERAWWTLNGLPSARPLPSPRVHRSRTRSLQVGNADGTTV